MIHYSEPKKLTKIIPKKIETTTIIISIKIISIVFEKICIRTKKNETRTDPDRFT